MFFLTPTKMVSDVKLLPHNQTLIVKVTHNSLSLHGKRIGHFCASPQKRCGPNKDLHKAGLENILISLEMNLGQNNCQSLYGKKSSYKIVVLTVLVFKKSLLKVSLFAFFVKKCYIFSFVNKS